MNCTCSGKIVPYEGVSPDIGICLSCKRYYFIRQGKPQLLIPWRRSTRRTDETCKRCLGPTDFNVRTQRRTCKDQLCQYSWCESQNSIQASRLQSMKHSTLERMAQAQKNGASQHDLVEYAKYIKRLDTELKELWATKE